MTKKIRQIIDSSELQELANQLYHDMYNDILTAKVVWTSELKDAGAWSKEGVIFINDAYHRFYGKEELKQTLKHELIHEHQYLTGRQVNHDSYFVSQSKKHIGKDTTYAKPYCFIGKDI